MRQNISSSTIAGLVVVVLGHVVLDVRCWKWSEWTRPSATVPLLLLHRVSGTICPMLSVTVLCLRTILRNCWRRTWWTVCRPRRLWRWIGAIRNKLIIIIIIITNWHLRVAIMSSETVVGSDRLTRYRQSGRRCRINLEYSIARRRLGFVAERRQWRQGHVDRITWQHRVEGGAALLIDPRTNRHICAKHIQTLHCASKHRPRVESLANVSAANVPAKIIKYLIPHLRPFKVTQGHWNRHESTRHLWFSISVL